MNTSVKNVLVGAGVIVALAFGGYALTGSEDKASTKSEPSSLGKELTEEEITNITKEVLQILSILYFVTQETTGSNTEPDSVSELIVQMTTESLKDKRDLEDLIPRVQKLVESKDKVVNVVGLGLFVGMQELIQADGILIEHLRTVDPSNPNLAEFQYQISSFGASQKSAFKNISMGAGQLPAIFWKLSELESKTGPIPYRISASSRQNLLSEIDRLFGEDLKKDEINHDLTGNRNAVLFIIQNYIDGLKFRTYEEANTLGN